MKFFVDENETAAIVQPLETVLFQHEFRSAEQEELGGVEDVDLFAEIARRGFDALITRDRNQLANRDERLKLIECGLHWIGHKEPGATGELLISCLVAGYVLALPYVVSAVAELGAPHAFHVRNVEWQQGQRVTIRELRR